MTSAAGTIAAKLWEARKVAIVSLRLAAESCSEAGGAPCFDRNPAGSIVTVFLCYLVQQLCTYFGTQPKVFS
jgi:hypothetical protein